MICQYIVLSSGLSHSQIPYMLYYMEYDPPLGLRQKSIEKDKKWPQAHSRTQAQLRTWKGRKN